MKKSKKQPTKTLIQVSGEIMDKVKRSDPETYKALKQVRKQVFLAQNRD